MIRLASFSLVFACSTLLLGASAQAQAPDKGEVEAYIAKIEETHKQLNNTGRIFGGKLADALKGGDKEALAIYRIYRDMAKLVFKIQGETKGFDVPAHELALAVKSANDRFLIYQREAVLSKIPAILDVVDDANLDADAKLEKVQAMLNRDNEREVALGKELREKIAALREAAK